MKILIHPHKTVYSHSTIARRRRIYAADEEIATEEDVEDTEGEATKDEDSEGEASPTVEETFEKLIKKLRKTSYDKLGDALEDIVSDPKLYAILSEGFGEGELSKVKMSSEPEAISVAKLLPTQSEIGLDNSLKFPLSNDCTQLFSGEPVTIVAPIVTYNGQYVIDGHHRWSQLYMMNPDAKINAINFEYEDQSPFRALRNFQGAIAVANKKVPKSYSKVNNVYDMSDDAIEDYLEKNLSDDCLDSLIDAGVCDDRDSAIEYLMDNIARLQDENFPFSPKAPKREYMPQTDEKALDIAEEGQTNI